MTDDTSSRGSFSWTSPEVAWPLAIATGFAGTLLGLSIGLPGAPALLAAAGFAPVFTLQLRHGSGRAALLGVAWCVGIAAAVLGGAVERADLEPGPWRALGALPLSDLVGAEVRLQAAGQSLDAVALLGRLAWAGVALTSARASRGVAGLLLAALAVGAAAGGVAPLVTDAVRAGAAVPLALTHALPVFAIAQASGVLAATAALLRVEPGSADPSRPRSTEDRPATSTPLWRAGVALVLGALTLEVLAGPLQFARLVALGS